MLQRSEGFFVIRTSPATHTPHAVTDFTDLPIRATKASIVHLSLLLECCDSNLKGKEGWLAPAFPAYVHLTYLCSKGWRGQATLPYLEVAHRALHTTPLLFLSCASGQRPPQSQSARR